MNGDLFTLFGDLINAVENVGDVELKIKTAWFGSPECKSRGKIGGEVLGQARAVLDDGAASVPHRTAHPETTPAVVIENLRRAGVSLIKCRDDALARHQRLIAGKSSSDRTVKVGFR